MNSVWRGKYTTYEYWPRQCGFVWLLLTLKSTVSLLLFNFVPIAHSYFDMTASDEPSMQYEPHNSIFAPQNSLFECLNRSNYIGSRPNYQTNAEDARRSIRVERPLDSSRSNLNGSSFCSNLSFCFNKFCGPNIEFRSSYCMCKRLLSVYSMF